MENKHEYLQQYDDLKKKIQELSQEVKMIKSQIRSKPSNNNYYNSLFNNSNGKNFLQYVTKNFTTTIPSSFYKNNG